MVAPESKKSNGAVAAPENQAVIKAAPMFSAEQLSEVTTFEDAMRLAVDTIGIETADVVGDGFNPIEKSDLVNREMLIMSWRFVTGDVRDEKTGEFREFAVVRAVCRGNNKKVLFTDGGTGICSQLQLFTKRLKARGLEYIPIKSRGLTVSEYQMPDGSPAKTYYIDTRPVDF